MTSREFRQLSEELRIAEREIYGAIHLLKTTPFQKRLIKDKVYDHFRKLQERLLKFIGDKA